MTLTIFDLDKTLLHGDSYDLWHEFLLEEGILDSEFIEENDKMIELYDEGKLDMLEYLKFSVNSLSKVSLDEISNLMAKYLEQKIKPIIYKEAKEWIAKFSPNLIISATPEYVVKPIAKLLKVDDSIGVKLKVKNGYYTDEYYEPLSFQEGKVKALKKYLEEKNLNPKKVVFYTDSINDLAMCEYSDEVHCINPDKKLEKIALQKGWDILRLSL
ncbi:HAD superfamily hydrolase, subfamily IB [Campylobacter blaseri]|uniref:HAD-IB family hydrolase n=1 Tax=Campylobacter blaseri TaxID=2042961 RepID=A0A2P8QZ72_9BACT|nr:HAD-IB family hydrolase [Campylobacter blaseri]PSM51542.1 HAD-IB family hydrolase [Campylobacter blaseri]PSM53335.1 HAD-IB family hydrolase [Campylobacter blaseri]QKF86628.1 HAD superfamily hydrolase, subfamily IB [Campylobacter blaseri]